MLRIMLENGSKALVLKLDGKVVGPWVAELNRVWKDLLARRHGEVMRVDLAEVTYVDSDGRKLLNLMQQQGARFLNARLLTKYVVEEFTRTPARPVG